ncbi:replication initiation protein [Campylobacter jejuni]|uniref:Replication initiation protein n=1 Tax=Campylobacter jejuni TaxID=197 RepID=A0AAN3QWY6_CAMJU|nr:replication initiation protein [Campylobacter jejuni]EHB2512634.1 replication initiation protein [Campylobacter jejuni]OEV69866.1 replication initiation protein [Campylobacter jejuni]OEW52877.1 replication initiation protein [Campylobacter jejuni]OEX73560.1 replication initiation protein [Campylobacter jejuni]OIN32445.1 replication initiation protein [Campylobacter jejuni]
MKEVKKISKTKIQKAIVTQNNRFVYAKYGMNTNELKMFFWIIAQINSQKDSLFQVCEMPLSQIFEVLNHQSDENYTYIKNLIDSMAKKTYIEDFKLLDEKTMKEVEIHRVMPLFQFIEYKKGASSINYRLNNSLMEYLLDQKRDFTQLKFNDIQDMKSAYSIRIYNMLLCELKQNRQSFKINLAVLQNLLEVPKSYYEWFDFNRFVLKQAEKDINGKSNLVLLEIKTYKTGRKITEIEFIYDYKNNDKKIMRDKIKKENYFNRLKEILSSYIGKSIYDERYGEMIVVSYDQKEDDKLFIVAERKSDGNLVAFRVKTFKDINSLEKLKDKAEELFYLDKQRVLKAKEAQAYRNLFTQI